MVFVSACSRWPKLRRSGLPVDVGAEHATARLPTALALRFNIPGSPRSSIDRSDFDLSLTVIRNTSTYLQAIYYSHSSAYILFHRHHNNITGSRSSHPTRVSVQHSRPLRTTKFCNIPEHQPVFDISAAKKTHLTSPLLSKMDASTSTQTSSCISSPVMGPVKDGSDSGYGSAASSTTSSTNSLPQVALTKMHLEHLNKQMARMSALDRLRFATVMFPNLYQSTAFGLTGLVTMDMLAKIQAESPGAPSIGTIFLDTLYHFNETYDLIDRVKAKFPHLTIHIYRPDGVETVAQFEEQYGEGLYDMAEELYDWIAKVEPQQRAYAELRVAAVLTGRRRSQGGARDTLSYIEVDNETGIIKINPLMDWTFAQVKSYIDEHDIPYNVLLDQGYKSIGDWHSTSPVSETEDERAGRWKGRAKTECGIHNKQSRYAQFLSQQAQNSESEKLSAALEKVERGQQISVM
ncbi:phosphoadenosine phosphosulfate reductase [Microdochium nivale]|nr:phosphoadenosine phosphosulfate reductase [Microdochium nivale]